MVRRVWRPSAYSKLSGRIGMGKMNVRFLGSGDAFGSGGRFQTCMYVRPEGFEPEDQGPTRLLVDCGASSLVAMKRYGVKTSDIDAILLSHLHGDHFGAPEAAGRGRTTGAGAQNQRGDGGALPWLLRVRAKLRPRVCRAERGDEGGDRTVQCHPVPGRASQRRPRLCTAHLL